MKRWLAGPCRLLCGSGARSAGAKEKQKFETKKNCMGANICLMVCEEKWLYRPEKYWIIYISNIVWGYIIIQKYIKVHANGLNLILLIFMYSNDSLGQIAFVGQTDSCDGKQTYGGAIAEGGSTGRRFNAWLCTKSVAPIQEAWQQKLSKYLSTIGNTAFE